MKWSGVGWSAGIGEDDAKDDRRAEGQKVFAWLWYNSIITSSVFERNLELIAQGEVRISLHGYEALAEDGLFVQDILEYAHQAIIVEEYPDYPKGPCALVLEHDAEGRPVHVVWGIPKGAAKPAVLVTAYRPDAGL